MGLVSELYQFARNNQLDIAQAFQSKEDILQTVQRMERNDLEKWLCDICLRMQTMLKEKRMNTTTTFVAKAQDYVNENYNDIDLNVDKICSHLGVSSAYFSTVFKKETGKSFTNFLTDIRMTKAVSLWIKEKRLMLSHRKSVTVIQTISVMSLRNSLAFHLRNTRPERTKIYDRTKKTAAFLFP
jgi:two-component system response regulator YesN